MALTISELAKGAGVGVETVRFYQRRGLLTDPRPSRYGGAKGRRHYGEDELRRLRFIRAAQRAGFTLDEIARLLELDRVDDRPAAREMARGRIEALDAKIAELRAARASLTKLARACQGGPDGPCPILESFADS